MSLRITYHYICDHCGVIQSYEQFDKNPAGTIATMNILPKDWQFVTDTEDPALHYCPVCKLRNNR